MTASAGGGRRGPPERRDEALAAVEGVVDRTATKTPDELPPPCCTIDRALVSPSHRHRVLAVLVGVLLVGHVVQPAPGIEPMILGWIPWDLGYHLLWMAAAAAVVWFMTDVVWHRDELERLRAEDGDR